MNSKRDFAFVAVLWAALTVVGELLALNIHFLPRLTSDKGADLEHAFTTLLVYAVPVFAVVVSVLAYMTLRYRAGAGELPPEDGPAILGRGKVPLAWFGTTSALAVLLMIYPGLIDLPKVLHDTSTPDLVVQIESYQWAWRMNYPQQGRQSTKELVLPVNQMVRFDITSLDVLHGFWIPAFGITMEAVPGQTTTVQYRATQVGAYSNNELLRAQCTELCGVAHSTMSVPVRVVSSQEFTDWLAQQAQLRPSAAPSAAGPSGRQ